MTENEKRQMNEGVNDPDIMKEGKAALACLILFVLAALVCGAVVGVLWLFSEIIKSLC